MLTGRMWKFWLGGGVGLVCGTGVAVAQPDTPCGLLCGCPDSCAPAGSHPIDDNTVVPPALKELQPGYSWWQNAPSFDRRPLVLLNFPETDGTNWTLDNNPEGLRAWWRKCGQNEADGTPVADEPTFGIEGPAGRPDQFVILLNQLDKLYSRYGFRRFAFKMPAGSYFGRESINTTFNALYFGGQDIPFAQWGALPDWKKTQFQTYQGAFQKWRRLHTDATFELYMGSTMMGSANTLHSHPNGQTYPGTQNLPPAPTSDTPELRTCVHNFTPSGSPVSAQFWIKRNQQSASEIAFDPHEKTHISRMYATILPWINCGFKMFWFDAGVTSVCSPGAPDYNRRRYGFEELASNPYFASKQIRFGAENIPAGSNHAEIECAAGRMAYMEEDSYMCPPDTSGNRHWRFITNPYWYPDTAPTTELHYLVTDALVVEGFSPLETIGEARLKGYVASPYFSKYNVDIFSHIEEYALNRVQRWYNQGKIFIADFDGNGMVNTADGDAFDDAFQRWKDYTGDRYQQRVNLGGLALFGMGNVNGDGKINDDDLVTFMEAYQEAVNGPPGSMGPTITFSSPTGL